MEKEIEQLKKDLQEIGSKFIKRVFLMEKLLDQIEISDYRDEHGHPLKNNVAYKELVG